MSIKGSPYPRFQRALATRNPMLVRSAAAELTHVDAHDALAVCLVFLDAEPDAYDRAAARWAARIVIQHRLSISDTQLALAALDALRGDTRNQAAETLIGLCEAWNLPRAGEVLNKWQHQPG